MQEENGSSRRRSSSCCKNDGGEDLSGLSPKKKPKLGCERGSMPLGLPSTIPVNCLKVERALPCTSAPATQRRFATASSTAKTPTKALWPGLIVAGLGNPGPEYARTRHNAGFIVVDALARQLGLKWERDKKCKAAVCRTLVTEKEEKSKEAGEEARGEEKSQAAVQRDLYLVKPRTFMNLSGGPLGKIMHAISLETGCEVTAENILVITDDLDQDIGALKMKGQGSPGGHNGLKSIEACLGTRKYYRLKVGISHPHRLVRQPGDDASKTKGKADVTKQRGAEVESVHSYVLGSFRDSELDVIGQVLGNASNAVLLCAKEGRINMDACMGKINNKAGPYQLQAGSGRN